MVPRLNVHLGNRYQRGREKMKHSTRQEERTLTRFVDYLLRGETIKPGEGPLGIYQGE